MEYGLSETEAKLRPDLNLGPGVGVDTLLARIASHTKALGDDRLHAPLAKDPTSPSDIAAHSGSPLCRRFAAMSTSSMDSTVCWTDDADTFCAGRLEMVLTAIVQSQPKVSIVLPTTRLPDLYKDGALAHLRVINLGGEGNVLHGLFEAHHAPEFPRDRFGPIFERTLGHPMASRFLALTAAEDGDIEEFVEQRRFLKLESLDRTEPLNNHIKRRIEKLNDTARKQLARCALSRRRQPPMICVIGLDKISALVGCARFARTNARGWCTEILCPFLGNPAFDFREMFDFDAMQEVGRHLHNLHKDWDKAGDVPGAISTAIEGNRLLIEARRERSVIRMAYPDFDALFTTRSMMNRRKPRLDIARSRNALIKVIKGHPNCCCQCRVAGRRKSCIQQVIAAYNDVHAKARHLKHFV